MLSYQPVVDWISRSHCYILIYFLPTGGFFLSWVRDFGIIGDMINRLEKLFLVLLRLALGWLFFYAGITKVLDPEWSAGAYLTGANNLTEFYHWLAGPTILPIINLINEWGLVLLGVSLILGLFVRWSAVLGALLMILYYLPILDFPYPDPHSFIIDQHIIYALALLYLATRHAGRVLGLDARLK